MQQIIETSKYWILNERKDQEYLPKTLSIAFFRACSYAHHKAANLYIDLRQYVWLYPFVNFNFYQKYPFRRSKLGISAVNGKSNVKLFPRSSSKSEILSL